jgi:hypothetical protein
MPPSASAGASATAASGGASGGASAAGASGGTDPAGGAPLASAGGDPVTNAAGNAGAGGASASAGAGGALAGAGAGGGEPNPPGVPADYALLIDESFAAPAALSKLLFADPQDWVYSSDAGGYIEATAASYAPPHASLHALAIFGDLRFGAFVLQAEVMQTNPSGGHRDFCLAWAIESPSRYYYAHIAQAHDAVAHNIHIVLDADRTAITKDFVNGFDWGTDVWHQLRVTRSTAGEMAVYADGAATPLLTASDTRLGAGYVGFGSFDDKGRVRNVKVWAPSAEPAAAGFFSPK